MWRLSQATVVLFSILDHIDSQTITHTVGNTLPTNTARNPSPTLGPPGLRTQRYPCKVGSLAGLAQTVPFKPPGALAPYSQPLSSFLVSFFLLGTFYSHRTLPSPVRYRTFICIEIATHLQCYSHSKPYSSPHLVHSAEPNRRHRRERTNDVQ
jgi:hypothetical protein